MDEGYISNDKKVVDIIRGAREGVITDFRCYQCEAKANIGRDRSERKSNEELKAELVKEQDEKLDLAKFEEEAKEKIEGERETERKKKEEVIKSAEDRAKKRVEESEKIKKMMEKEKEELVEKDKKTKAEIEQERKATEENYKKQQENEQKAKEEGEKAELARKEEEEKRIEGIIKAEKEKEKARILKKNQEHSNYLIVPNKSSIKSFPVIGYSGKIQPCNGYLDFYGESEAMATDIYMSFYYEISRVDQGEGYYSEQTKGDMKNYCLECSRKIFERWGMALNNSAMIESMKTQEEIKRLLKPSNDSKL